MAVGPDPLEGESERDSLEQAVVLARRRLAAELTANPMHGPWLHIDPVEHRLAHESIVRALVVRRHAALVAPPERRRAPVGLELGCQLVRRARGRAAGERDVVAAAGSAGEKLSRRAVGFRCGREDLQNESASLSSFERSIAAWIAFRNAARTPARSSSRIARIVVPPGEVTCSRSSTGWSASSRSSRAVPSMVCTTSWVDTSRDSPSRIPASIMASASKAKYAGPDPETAVTASM